MNTDLGRQAVQGVAWLGSGHIIRQALGLITTFVLARLLSPDDFGLFAMSYIAAEFAQVLTSFGLGSAIVQRGVNRQEVLSACFWVSVGLGLFISAGLVGSGPILAAYFQREEITLLMLPLAINVVVGSIAVVPQSLLSQRLEFRSLVKAQTVGSVAGAIAAMGYALWHPSFWALAIQPLVGNLATGAINFLDSRWVPSRRIHFAPARELLGFSMNLLGSNLLGFAARSFPGLILGRQLGATALAHYGVASHITGAAVLQFSAIIVRVLFPALSSLKDEPQRMVEAWLRATSCIALVAMPVMAGVWAAADDLVLLLLGAQWGPAASPLRALAVAMAVQAVFTTSGTVLLSLGRSDRLMQIALVTTPAYALAIWYGSNHGLLGAALGHTTVTILSVAAITSQACKLVRMPVKRVLMEIMPWVMGALLAALAMRWASAISPLELPVARLAMVALVGFMVYGLVVTLAGRRQLILLFADIREKLWKRAAR